MYLVVLHNNTLLLFINIQNPPLTHLNYIISVLKQKRGKGYVKMGIFNSPADFQIRWTARKSCKLFRRVYLTQKCSRGLMTPEQEAVIIRPGQSKQMLGNA